MNGEMSAVGTPSHGEHHRGEIILRVQMGHRNEPLHR